VSTTETSTEAAHVAELIRSAAAWWRCAADRLDAGDLEQASNYARLGQFGTGDAVERIAALDLPAVETATASGDAVQPERDVERAGAATAAPGRADREVSPP
jgi:hypothetical protein